MRSNKKQTLRAFFTSKILCAVLIALAISAGFAITAGATDNSQNVFDKNYNLAELKIKALGTRSEEYTALDESSGKEISQKVTLVLAEYRKQLVDLQAHADAHIRDLSGTIEAIYARGDAAGKLTWICYYNLSDLYRSESTTAVKDLCDEDISILNSKTSAAVIEAEATEMCNALNRLVYQKKLEELQLETDTWDAKVGIKNAIAKLSSVTSSDLFGEGYIEIYESAKDQLTLQRTRDALLSDMKQIFAIVRPEEIFSSNDAMLIFGASLENAKSLAEMNEAARVAICVLTTVPENEGYSYIFVNKLCSDAADIVLKANKAKKYAELLPLFNKFDINFSKAKAKDEIYLLLFENAGTDSKELTKTEKLFNEKNGRVDACETKEAIEVEIKRAEFFKSLHDSVSETRETLSIILADYDRAVFEERINNCFSAISAELESMYGGVSFVENCNLSLKNAEITLKTILSEARAERFLLKYKNILTKQKEDLALDDELDLRACINAYLELDSSVQETLDTQISSIVEKYKILFAAKIRMLMSSDAFYLELCENICNEIKNLQEASIVDFYNNCDLIFKKATSLKSIVTTYRQTVNGSTYGSYTTTERNELAELCKNAANEISSISISSADVDLLDHSLNRVLENTTISITAINEYARVRISSRNSSSLDIEKLLTEAKAKIDASRDKNEMTAIADASIYKINRTLTVNEIRAQCDKIEYLIGEMRFLASDEKTLSEAKIKSLRSSALDGASRADNITVLTFVWDTFNEDIFKIFNAANEKDISAAREKYTSQIDKDAEDLASEIDATAHLTTARRNELKASLISVCSKFKSETISSKSSDELVDAYTDTIHTLDSIRLSAFNESLSNYKLIISAELDKLKNVKESYSAENYKKIEDIVKAGKEKLSSCSKLSECSGALADAQSEIAGISNLLDDARANANDRLSSLIKVCRDNSSLYSEENLKRAEAVYSEACEKISAYTKISEIGTLNATLAEYISSLRSIKRDRVYSSELAATMTEQGAEYPGGYDFELGYWGNVYSHGGIDFDSVLSIKNTGTDADAKKIQALLHKAAKDGKLTAQSSISDEQLKLLKKGVVSLALDISLSTASGNTDMYTLQMLLPPSLKDERILGAIFVDENNNIQFYSAEQNDMLLTLQLSHFSDYFIISEKTVDLTPLLVFLIILLILEVATFCFILFLRYYRKRKETKMLPGNLFYSLTSAGTFALRVKPQNAVGLTLLLTVAVLALGCGIAFLAKLELAGTKKKRDPKNAPQTDVTGTEPVRLLHSVQRPQLKENNYHTNDRREGTEGKLLSVATEYASESFDADIQAIVYDEDIAKTYDTEEAPFTSHRAEINLDVIAENFQSGELVTLEALKQKKLIAKKTDHLKILARGTLKKPLIIEAQDFSRAAEKMLIAAGGEAIRIK